MTGHVRDLHDGGPIGNRAHGFPSVENSDDEGARIRLLYARDALAATTDLERIGRLVRAGHESAAQHRADEQRKRSKRTPA